MLFHRLAERAEHNTVLCEFFLVGGGDRHTVEDRINGDVAQALLLTQRDAELVEGLQQFGIHFIKARLGLLLFGSGVINDVLIIDRVIAELGPVGLLKGEPVPKRLEAELEKKVGLLLLAGDQSHHLLIQSLGDFFGLDVRDKAVLVRLAHEIPRGGGGHGGSAGGSVDHFGGDGLRISTEGIVLGQEQHAVALLPLTHRHAGAVPEGLGNFSFLVLIVTAWAQSSPELILVAGKTLEHHSGHAGVAAEVGSGSLGVGLSESADDFEALRSGF